ncbi:hypothetical protein Axy10_018 [Achromobacter phage vB_AxyP_19-32_Axy10]|uniref:Uncharacterized protein n=1 Tax=Achromobacter phage vB_AxyP_19-32_Axy10 TaxID=2591041 RepID=A0A514CTX4_9CAUD|nr:hypothetical protein KMC59_gp18 [Achromobacter phage vB_AxyP_19-32_Axy10]QDH83923.1 hypothetical protein Axy10_018 [Achromobacter phage vB_AxyP_19-32_Axy10]
MNYRVVYNAVRKRFIVLPEGEVIRFSPSLPMVGQFVHDHDDRDSSNDDIWHGISHVIWHHVREVVQKAWGDNTNMSDYTIIMNSMIDPPWEDTLPPEVIDPETDIPQDRDPVIPDIVRKTPGTGILVEQFNPGSNKSAYLGVVFRHNGSSPKPKATYDGVELETVYATSSFIERIGIAMFKIENMEAGTKELTLNFGEGQEYGPLVGRIDTFPSPKLDSKLLVAKFDERVRGSSFGTGSAIGGYVKTMIGVNSAVARFAPKHSGPAGWVEDASQTIYSRRLVTMDKLNIKASEGVVTSVLADNTIEVEVSEDLSYPQLELIFRNPNDQPNDTVAIRLEKLDSAKAGFSNMYIYYDPSGYWSTTDGLLDASRPWLDLVWHSPKKYKASRYLLGLRPGKMKITLWDRVNDLYAIFGTSNRPAQTGDMHYFTLSEQLTDIATMAAEFKEQNL